MSRLRPINRAHDYGYISRVDGDRQLSDYTNQETFFAQLVENYALQPLCSTDRKDWIQSRHESKANEQATNVCLSSLRKLREGVIASNRTDDFAIDLFERVARYSILHSHMESYVPTLQHLQNILYRSICESKRVSERQVVNGLLSLHLCSREEYRQAFELRQLAGPDRVQLVDRLIRAQIHCDWISWQRLLRDIEEIDILQHTMAMHSTARIAQRTINAVATAYMHADVDWIDRICGKDWQDALALPKCAIEDGIVIFKRGKTAKPAPTK